MRLCVLYEDDQYIKKIKARYKLSQMEWKEVKKGSKCLPL